ncbi:MAG: 30S ribosomal protein S8 [Dehalococcoidia bacterium]|nr:30S ribosomal protein S8 [Dehalococcoidia bacterium]
MTMTDPIADMLTRLRNGVAAKHDAVTMPASKMKIEIAKILKDEGFIRDFEVTQDAANRRSLKVLLRYTDKKAVLSGLQRVSKPGLRVYVQRTEIPRVFGGLGIAIMSTPQGVMTGAEAWRKRVGGEVLCYVW